VRAHPWIASLSKTETAGDCSGLTPQEPAHRLESKSGCQRNRQEGVGTLSDESLPNSSLASTVPT
jgi:hypothetical protein